MRREIEIPSGPVTIRGILNIPADAKGFIAFAHGSGSGRLSPRNTFVADILNAAGFSTLLIDLLTPEEENDRRNVFDIDLLAGRLADATAWAENFPETKSLPIGYFGASTGAAAALQAAAKLEGQVRAVVSRGGRPDLAMQYLPKVTAATLLIVGGNDQAIIPLNEAALEKLTAKKELKIITAATHLFEEPGALEEVSRLTADWFLQNLPRT